MAVKPPSGPPIYGLKAPTGYTIMANYHYDEKPRLPEPLSEERVERLRKQCAFLPGDLAIDDKKLIRLLAAAGGGGDY